MPRKTTTEACECKEDPLLVVEIVTSDDACGDGCCREVVKLYQCPECKTIWSEEPW